MNLYKIFFSNISMLLAMTYLVNILTKYSFSRTNPLKRECYFVFIAIAGGWLSMFFGLPLPNGVLFDLRFVPLIIAPIFVKRSYLLFLLGAGIGLTRLTLGQGAASWVGFANMVILGLIAAGLNEQFKRFHWSSWQKITCFIFVINIFNVINIAWLGVIPAEEYLTRIATVTFPLSLMLSSLFAFILYDFQLEYRRLEHMQVINDQLVEQNVISENKTKELIRTKESLEEQTELLTLSSKYKSEFLANMSHELRTPLNGLLILSQMLADNQMKNLSPEEVSYAEMIHSSGNDLLVLINDILDLSKIEAGRAELVEDAVNMSELPQMMERFFHPLALKKKLTFFSETSSSIPDIIYTDGQRLQQILKNLLSNAFKFTEKGSVSMKIQPVEPEEMISINDADPLTHWISFVIEDTGIGIPEDKLTIIFEAFQQVDGTTSRKYGGTGLGLSISREFASLLGGFITLDSRLGLGSCFTLYLPYHGENIVNLDKPTSGAASL